VSFACQMRRPEATANSSVENRFVSCYNTTRISRASHKSLLCKVGMTNSRNTCVDMHCACIACRPLDGTRLLCSYPSALQESLWLLSLHAFLFRTCIHARDVKLYSPLLQLPPLRHTMQRAFRRVTRQSGFCRFPHALILFARTLAMVRNSHNLSRICSVLLLGYSDAVKGCACRHAVNTARTFRDRLKLSPGKLTHNRTRKRTANMERFSIRKRICENKSY